MLDLERSFEPRDGVGADLSVSALRLKCVLAICDAGKAFLRCQKRRCQRLGNALGTPRRETGGVALLGSQQQVGALACWRLTHQVARLDAQRLGELPHHGWPSLAAVFEAADCHACGAGAPGELRLDVAALETPVEEARHADERRAGHVRGHGSRLLLCEGGAVAWRVAIGGRHGDGVTLEKPESNDSAIVVGAWEISAWRTIVLVEFESTALRLGERRSCKEAALT